MLRATSGEQLRDLRTQFEAAGGADEGVQPGEGTQEGDKSSGAKADKYAGLPPAVAALAHERDELRREVARLEDEVAMASASASRADAQQRLVAEGAEQAARRPHFLAFICCCSLAVTNGTQARCEGRQGARRRDGQED